MRLMLKLALRNIFRNKRRTILTLSGIGITVFCYIAMLSWIDGFIEEFFDTSIRLQSGHLKVVHEKYYKKERMLPLHYSVKPLDRILEVVKKTEDVKAAYPRIKFGAQLEFEGKTMNCLGMALRPVEEKDNIKLKDFLLSGKYWDNDEDSGIVIGYKTAEELGVKVGDPVTVLVRTADFSVYLLEYNVRAIFKVNVAAIDKGMFYINIKDASDLLNMPDEASEILVMIGDKKKAPEMKSKIESLLQKSNLLDGLIAIPWQEQSGMERLLKMTNVSIGIMLGIFAVVAGLTILNTMLMAVFERSYEIGMMRALGMRKFGVLKLVLLEALIIGIIGGLFGGITGSAFSYFYLEKVGIKYPEAAMEQISGWTVSNILKADFQWSQLITAFIFGLALAVIAAFYPAWKASRMRPADTLRTL